MARWVCRVLGAVFVLLGLAVIVGGRPVDPYHNLLHLATGAAALYVGFARSLSAAQRFCLGFGACYLALGALGFALGDPSMNRLWQAGPLSLDSGDHGFHVVLGFIFLASGLFTRRKAPTAREAVSS
jgi:uncharacterized protein DUF4383